MKIRFRSHSSQVLVRVLLTLLATGCASQAPPSGGPPDREPPIVVSTSPSEGELNVRGERFVVRFSEYIDHRSFQESVFLSPSAGALKFEWSGSEVEIIPAETLRSGTTFILTIGTDLRDTRNNALAQSFTLAFSTGGTIDSGAVSGRVFDESPGGVMIYAYRLPDAGEDAPSPATTIPDYLTQTGADGTFRLPNLHYGRYRILAVRDVFKNLLYDVQTDMYGMPFGDIDLLPSEREIGGLFFILSSEDTLRPYLSGAKASDNERVVVRFNEPPQLRGLGSTLSLADTLTGSDLKVLNISPVDTGGREFLLVTAPQDSGAIYRLSFGDFTDRAGNHADSAGRSMIFTGGAGADSALPVISFSVGRDSTTGVLPGAGLRVSSSRPLDTTAFTRGFSVVRSDNSPVPGTLVWEGSMFAHFEPETFPVPGEWYGIRLAQGSISDVRGRSVADSTYTKQYRIIEKKFLGSIDGRVVRPAGWDSIPAGHALMVKSVELSGAGKVERTAAAESDGSFFFHDLPEGRYVISAYIDVNGNRRFDPGSPYPARFSERFTVYPDTVKIRPGWPVEGVRLDFEH